MTSDQLAQLFELRELMGKISEPEYYDWITGSLLRADAQFIALSRNLLPTLLQERDEMLKEIRELHLTFDSFSAQNDEELKKAFKGCNCKFCGGEK